MQLDGTLQKNWVIARSNMWKTLAHSNRLFIVMRVSERQLGLTFNFENLIAEYNVRVN